MIDPDRRRRVAFVVQRYGRGGSELHCQWVAEHLAERHDVTVLTTCALDHQTWANHFPPGETRENDVTIVRFPTVRERARDFLDLSDRVLNRSVSRDAELAWLRAQGPHSPELLERIERDRDRYDVMFFFTYLYEPTALGLPRAAERAVLIPTAHDEPPIRLSIYRDVFLKPKWIIYNTLAERRFINGLFHNEHVPGSVCGCGLATLPPGDADRFRRKHGVDGDLLVYVGRVEASKGCGELVDWARQHRRRRPFTLALLGQNVMNVAPARGILPLGYVSDQEKADALAAATLFVMPSENESLSLVTLEAWEQGVPVLVNGRCTVFREHVRHSQGGLHFSGREEFWACLDYLLDHPEQRARMGRNGRRYVTASYGWDRINAIYDRVIDAVAGPRLTGEPLGAR